MTHPLDGARAKISRAKDHLKTLDRDIRKYLGSNPYRIRHEVNPEHTRYVFRAQVIRPIPQTAWGLIIGDCVHNARSALDLLTWGVAEHFTPSNPGDTRTQFPVYLNGPSFRKDGVSRIERLPVRVQALIKWLQPYRRAHKSADALAILHALDIADKHKVIAVTASILGKSRITLTAPLHTRVHFNQTIQIGRFDHGTVVGEFEVLRYEPLGSKSPANPKVKVHDQFAFDISFGEGLVPETRFNLVRPSLGMLIACAERVVTLVGRILSKHHGLP